MAADWMATTLGRLIDQGEAELFTGPFGTQLHAHDYEASGVPVVPTEAIGRRLLRTENLPHVSDATASRLARYRLRAGDILFARRGVQATGSSALVLDQQDGWICGTGAIVLRPQSTTIDPAFLSFSLSADTTISWLKSRAVGAVMPNLNEGVLRSLPVRFPPLPEQRAIAHILGTLDDKIALNRRMNATLEAMARALFQSWFVDFDPVRARAEGRQPAGMDAATAALFPDGFAETELGEVPKGWEIHPLPEVIEINPPRRLARGKTAPYVEMANLPTNGPRVTGWEDREFGSGMRFINGDVLLARITPCLENGKTACVDFLPDGEVGWGSTEYIVLHAREMLHPLFVYYLARSSEFRTFAIQNMTGTSGRQRVPAECFTAYPLVVPPRPLITVFGAFADGALRAMKQHDEETATLAALRDGLLPKLLSGEIRVGQAERALEAVL